MSVVCAELAEYAAKHLGDNQLVNPHASDSTCTLHCMRLKARLMLQLSQQHGFIRLLAASACMMHILLPA